MTNNRADERWAVRRCEEASHELRQHLPRLGCRRRFAVYTWRMLIARYSGTCLDHNHKASAFNMPI